MKNLAFEFCVSVRTIQYDIAFLSLFYPLMTVQGKHGGVFVVEGYRMGNEYLSQEEQQFLKGLQNNLPDKYQAVIQSILRKFSLKGQPGQTHRSYSQEGGNMLLGGSSFQLSNLIFHYKLSSHELAVYSYLKSCAGNRSACQVKVNTIAKHSGCSVSSARRALHSLRDKGFIDIKGNAQMLRNGGHRQTCNHYYLLDSNEWRMPETAPPSSMAGEMYE